MKKAKESLCCRECHKLMKRFIITGIFDIFGKNIFYCDNNKCKRFGDLTLGGLKK